ncbi:unannotated protein [freshwater metagenome]|uniref:Unannotated protein n=1 Tax=freshwater metagenome TaxID=449393 RepID=A0A6J6RIF7_9ZZZZ
MSIVPSLFKTVSEPASSVLSEPRIESRDASSTLIVPAFASNVALLGTTTFAPTSEISPPSATERPSGNVTEPLLVAESFSSNVLPAPTSILPSVRFAPFDSRLTTHPSAIGASPAGTVNPAPNTTAVGDTESPAQVVTAARNAAYVDTSVAPGVATRVVTPVSLSVFPVRVVRSVVAVSAVSPTFHRPDGRVAPPAVKVLASTVRETASGNCTT